MHRAHWQAPQTGWAVCEGEESLATMDMQIRLVASLEDAYWHTHFSQEPYYVAGRSYDQYRPAYLLGWESALQYPDASFMDLSKQLERQWASQRGSSLLPWREVHMAARNAWQHAGMQMHMVQHRVPTLLLSSEVDGLIRPLHSRCLALADDLQRMRLIPMSDFAHQVFERHIQMLQRLEHGLLGLMPREALQGSASTWHKRLRCHWWKFRFHLSDCVPAQVFEVCEHRERKLLSVYQRTLGNRLPPEAKELLQSHAKQLQSHVQKLSWVRHNVVL